MRIGKTKLSVTCVYKLYEIKIKMVAEQRIHLNMKFLLGHNMLIVIFSGVGKWKKFRLVEGGGSLSYPQVGKICNLVF